MSVERLKTRNISYLSVTVRECRQVLLDNSLPFCEPTLDIFLYGNSELSGAENKLILFAVQEFIIKSNRFKY